MVSKKKEEPTVMLINPAVAFVSAMEILAAARKIGLDQKKPEVLVDVANAWIEMGSQLLSTDTELVYGDDEAETVAANENNHPVGFTIGGDDEETESGTGTEQD